MFAFLRGKRGDLFDQRKRQMEVCRRLRRIVDSTAPKDLPSDSEVRCYKRYNRSVPVVVIPCDNGDPDMENALFGVTKDFSDTGISLLLSQMLKAEAVVCGFWLDNPLFAAAKVAHTLPFGAGFWQVGLHVYELLEGSDVDSLLPLAEQLRPEAPKGLMRMGV